MEKLTTMKIIMFFFPLWGNNITIRVRNGYEEMDVFFM